MGGFSTRFGSPSLPVVTLDPTSNAYPAGHHLGDPLGLSHLEPDLISDNVRAGIVIFGVTGNMDYFIRYISERILQSVLVNKVTVDQTITKSELLSSAPLYALTDDPTDLIRVLAPTADPLPTLSIVTAPDSIALIASVGSTYDTSVA